MSFSKYSKVKVLLRYIPNYSLSILKRQLERNLSLIAALPNDGCYSKQRATSYVYLQTLCVRQILRMRYWVMMPNEACIRMFVHWAANEIHYQTYIFFNILIMWHRLKVNTEDLAPARFSCAKSRFFHWIKWNSFYSIALQVYFCIHIIHFLQLKNISSKNKWIIIKKIIVLTCDIWQSSITSQRLSNFLFKMDRL